MTVEVGENESALIRVSCHVPNPADGDDNVKFCSALLTHTVDGELITISVGSENVDAVTAGKGTRVRRPPT